MRILTAHVIERVVTGLAVTAILAMTGILFYFLSLRLGDIARENQAYDRFMSCVLSVPALDRDHKKIDQCYKSAEQDSGMKIKRYDLGNNNE